MTASIPMADVDRRRLLFRVGEQRHEIDASQVLEVIRVPHITRVPNGPEALAGIANLRGKPIPILAMTKVLHGSATAMQNHGKVIVYDHGGALGLLVDDVLRLSTDTLSAPLHGLPALLDAAFKQTRLARVEREHASGSLGGTQAEETSKLIALLSFRVAGQLYGLPLDDIREVSGLPEEISVFGNAPDSIIGIIPLRGGVLPLVSLASLLGLDSNQEGSTASFIVVVEHEGQLLGLVVNDLDVIRRLPDHAIDAIPAVLQKGRGDAQIEAIGRIAEGGQLISILSPEKLFGHKEVTQAIARNQGAKPMEATGTSVEALEQFLIFQLGDETYGLPVRSVDEVVRVPSDITRVPGAPSFVVGVINLRGKAVPLIDQRARFDTPSTQQSAKTRAIVLTLGQLQAGFVIDGVSEVKAIASSALSEAPKFSSEQTDVFDRVAHIEADGRMILLIDPQELLSRAERDVVASIANDVTAAVGP